SYNSTYLQSCSRFFFQAEDGIRDRTVTGVQTCALPISRSSTAWHWAGVSGWVASIRVRALDQARPSSMTAVNVAGRCAVRWRTRSEERRVGKEWRGRGWPGQEDRWGCRVRD